MHNAAQLNGVSALGALGGFGRIGRRYPLAPAAQRKASIRTTARPDAPLRDENATYSLRSFFANGFGDAGVDDAPPHQLLSSVELYHEARAHRAFLLTQIGGAIVRAFGSRVRRIVASWKRRQHATATYRALSALDTRTLRDLGFDRSELLSIAAEVAGNLDSTRAHLGQSWLS